MKTKIFKQKLLTAGAIAALGLGLTTSAQADPSAYAVSIQKISNFSAIFQSDGQPLPIVEAIDFPNASGTLTSATSCTTTNLGNDAPPPVGAAFPPLPIPVTIDPLQAECNVVPAAAQNFFDRVGEVGDYARGDAEILDTNINVSGAAANIGEVYTSTPEDTPDGAPDNHFGDVFRGEGRNTLSQEFTMLQDATLKFDFDAEYLAYVKLVDAGTGSLADAAITFLLTITDVTDGNPATVVHSFAPVELNVIESQAGNNVDEVLEDGANVFSNQTFMSESPLLVQGNTYKLEIRTVEDTTVTLFPGDVNGDLGDHYLCYKSFGHFLREEVNLVDQFDNVNFKVLKPKMFCNPAMKPELDPEEGIVNPEAHLLSYKINEAHRQPRHERRTVIMRDQFGLLELETVNPDRLMVPSGKSLDPADNPGVPGGINHFKCYRVRTLGGFQSIPVNVADQFTDPDPFDLTLPPSESSPVGKDLVLVRPKRMCTPVSKNGEEIIENPDANPDDPRDHLMCYAVKAGSGARLHRRREVRSNNQFGLEDLVLKRELEFCAPASKTVIN